MNVAQSHFNLKLATNVDLWTWHMPDFSITSGKVNIQKSEYVDTIPLYVDSYKKLLKVLKVESVVWCYANKQKYEEERQNYFQIRSNTKIEWCLKVPKEKIIAIVDHFIWVRILGRPEIPRSLQQAWYQEEVLVDSVDGVATEDKELAYKSKQPKTGDWWDELFIDNFDWEGALAIIEHPIDPSWIVPCPPMPNHLC